MIRRKKVNDNNKYNRRLCYTLEDENGVVLPFDSFHLLEMFAKQGNISLDKVVKFDSKLERDRSIFLKGLEKKGVIKDLKLQVKFEIIPPQKVSEVEIKPDGSLVEKKPKSIRKNEYVCDFQYYYKNILFVEDTKSPPTRAKPEYKLKKKLMLLNHNIWIKEVMKDGLYTL